MDGERFPATRHSVVAALAGSDPVRAEAAWDALVRAYWRPVYVYLRHRWRAAPHDAEDFTQEFFARAHAKGFFDDFDPARARFRTYLRVCLDRFVLREREAEGRLKRGGGAEHLSLDFAGAERELPAGGGPAADGDPDALFEREWVRALFADAVEALRRQAAESGRAVPFEVFRLYDLEDPDPGERPTYEALARRLGIPATQVTNHLHAMRRAFRREVLARVRAVAGSDAEFRAEARELLGDGEE